MAHYLNYQFQDTPATVSTFDEMPLWSASFGLLLLRHVPLKAGIAMLDIGCGTGFPLFELAQRLGPTATCYGIDPWEHATNRAKEKIANYEVPNVQILNISAEIIPFQDNSIDLIVSNLGINNFTNPGKVIQECNRVLKPDGTLAITTNLNGHWHQFYKLFKTTLSEMGSADIIPAVTAQEEHRGSIDSIAGLFLSNGMELTHHYTETMEMRFLNGTAFLNHSFIKLGWFSSWIDLIPADICEAFFANLENNLNEYAMLNNGLTLTVPMAYMEFSKTDKTILSNSLQS